MISNTKMMLENAYENKYAIAQFNINNLEWTKYILEECEQLKTPVILGVSEGAIKYMGGAKVVSNIVTSLIEELNITINVALHLDHGSSLSVCQDCINAGFTSVMFDGSHYPIAENIEKTKEAVIDQLEEIKNGNFTNEDINFAEMAIKNDFKSVADSAGNVSNWYFDCIRKNDIVTPEEKLGRYLGVSKERIIAAAKSMVLDSVYVLTGNEN